jgi:glycosyltransferase involved in cell wall biosynthesis
VSTDFISSLRAPGPAFQKNGVFTVGYVGRLAPVKGVDLITEAFVKTKEPSARLRIVGWEPENAQTPYARRIQDLAGLDNRITLVPRSKFSGTIEEYRGLSLLVIPSVWMETGPLTLFEALALGVPVYGSNRIGQLAMLKEKGRVVEPNTVEAWGRALQEAFDLWRSGAWRQVIERAHCNGELRTMKKVSEEMAEHYKRALARG